MQADALSLIAQLSLGLAGFAGVVVLLGRGPGKWHPIDALRIRMLLTVVFAPLFSSLVPIGIEASGGSPALAIRVGATVLFLFILYYFQLSRNQKRVDPAGEVFNKPHLKLLVRGTGALAGLAQLPVISGYGGSVAFLLFFAGLVWCLFRGAFGFVLLIYIRPREN